MEIPFKNSSFAERKTTELRFLFIEKNSGTAREKPRLLFFNELNYFAIVGCGKMNFSDSLFKIVLSVHVGWSFQRVCTR